MGRIDWAVPKLRKGSYVPSFLKPRRRTAEKALTVVIQEAYARDLEARQVSSRIAMAVTEVAEIPPAGSLGTAAATWLCPAPSERLPRRPLSSLSRRIAPRNVHYRFGSETRLLHGIERRYGRHHRRPHHATEPRDPPCRACRDPNCHTRRDRPAASLVAQPSQSQSPCRPKAGSRQNLRPKQSRQQR